IAGTRDRVMGLCSQGAYAPKIAAQRNQLFPVPAGWSSEEAAAFLVNYLTAHLAYWMAGMTDSGAGKGKSVLIHAVAGAGGTAAVESGGLLGVEMYGTSSSDDKLARARALGLQHGINYNVHDYEDEINRLPNGKGVDAVFEMLGGEHTAASTRCLNEMGTLI